MNALDLLNQSEVWTDRAGTTRRLEAMTPEHRRAVVGHLLRQADRWHMVWRIEERYDWRDLGIEIDLPEDPAAVLTWIEATPLMRRLRELEPDAPRLADMLLHTLTHGH